MDCESRNTCGLTASGGYCDKDDQIEELKKKNHQMVVRHHLGMNEKKKISQGERDSCSKQ